MGLVSIGGVCLTISPSIAQSIAQTAMNYREQGIVYRDQGRLSEAIAAFQDAVALEPDNLAGRVNLGWTLHLAGSGREAADVLAETIWIDPSHVQTFNALGIVYLVNDDLAGAVLTHAWATFLKPDNEIAHYNLSLAYQRLQEYDWAIAAAQRATALEPDNPHPVVAEAIAHWSKGDEAMGKEVYQRAIEMDGRYRNSTFLTYLDRSGFSADQITLCQEILKAVSP